MLDAIPCFQPLSAPQRAEVAALGKQEHFGRGQAVFHEGDVADRLFVVLAGRVKVHRRDPEGNGIDLATLGAGDVFGELGLFDGRPRSATVSTLEDCKFFTLDRAHFLAVLQRHPVLIPFVLASTGEKMRGMDEKYVAQMIEKQNLRTEMEKERYRSLAQLVAGVAHEINTPLGIVNTAASILTERLTPEAAAALAGGNEDARVLLEDVLEAARLIQGNLERANKLVQSFKNLSVSQVAERKEEFDLPALVGEVVGLFKPWARRANLAIEIRDLLGTRPRLCLGYPGHISQILLNLLSNAERYAYPGGKGGRLLIEISAQGSPLLFALAVRDFGVGIPAENLPRICEAFFTTGRTSGGTGLGMAIVHNLVTAALKGSIDIRSGPGLGGGGTEVTVLFPQRLE